MRPGVRAFLDAAHERYEMHVYTMGDRAYARAMAAALDPDGRLFSGRVISAVRSGDARERKGGIGGRGGGGGGRPACSARDTGAGGVGLIGEGTGHTGIWIFM